MALISHKGRIVVHPNTFARTQIAVRSAILRIPRISSIVISRIARMFMRFYDRPRQHSWAHARAE